MSVGGAIFAFTALQAVSQVSQGYAQKAEANFNASLLEGQARLIDVQKDIEAGQYKRMGGQAVSTTIARTAGAGLGFSGSPAAVAVATLKQIEIDKAIGQFNLEQQKNYKMAEASAQRRAGKYAVQSGWTNALITGAQGFASYKLATTGMPKNTTFDSRQMATQFVYGGRK